MPMRLSMQMCRRPKVAVICDAKTILAAMLRPAWVGACMLDVTDDTEAHLTVLDLAAKPPAKFDILRCLLASGATPTGRMVLRLARNCCDDGSQENDTLGGRNGLASFASVRDCFLGAIAASDWPTNPLIPGLNLSVALIEAVRQVSVCTCLVVRVFNRRERVLSHT